MEKTNAIKAHYHVVLVCGFNNLIVADASAWLCYNCNAALSCSFDIVSEREECVATDGNVCVLVEPCAFFFACENFRLNFENVLPFAFCKNVFVFFTDVNVNCVVTVCAFDSVNELQSKDFRALSEPPVVGLLTCEACTVNAALLAGTNTNCLTVFYVAD